MTLPPRVRAAAIAAFAAALLPAAAAPAPANTTEAEPETDVPFVTTPDNVTLAMLELAGLGPQDHLVDLGSGDGRIPILAARRFGASALGVEIVPDLVQRSREAAARAGVAGRARFVVQDIFDTDLQEASVVTLYLLPAVNLQLRPRLLALAAGTRIVSHDWDMGDWTPDRTITVNAPDKPVGREKLSRLHLWVVPARIAGRWCEAGRPAIELRQRFQRFEGEWLGEAGAERRIEGRIAGSELLDAGAGPVLRLRDGALHAASGARRYTPCPA